MRSKINCLCGADSDSEGHWIMCYLCSHSVCYGLFAEDARIRPLIAFFVHLVLPDVCRL